MHTELNGSYAEKKSVLVVSRGIAQMEEHMFNTHKVISLILIIPTGKIDSERNSYFTCNDEVVGSSPAV